MFASKVVLVLCAQALFIQVALCQCGCSGSYLNGLGASYAPQISAPCAAPALPTLSPSCASGIPSGLQIIPTSGGLLLVTSSSALAPSGISVASENVYEGGLNVIGELPFVSSVALEGAFPSAGTGVVSYSCGNGVTAISSQGNNLGAGAVPAFTPGISSCASAAPAAVFPSFGSANGCGCGRY